MLPTNEEIISMFNPKGHVEVLALCDQGEYVAMYLHKEGSDTVICDSPAAYARRVTLPHVEVFETRSLRLSEVNSHRSKACLSNVEDVLPGKKSDNPQVLESFTELFLVATGHYYPNMRELIPIV